MKKHMAKYGKQAQESVRKEMHEMKRGKSRAKHPKQAIAIGLSKARAKGAKMPPKKKK